MPDGGETLRAFSARVEAIVIDLAGRHSGETLLIVTHGGALDIAHRLATGQGLEVKREFSLLNAAINWIERRDGRWALLSWGETAHLKRARDEAFDGLRWQIADFPVQARLRFDIMSSASVSTGRMMSR